MINAIIIDDEQHCIDSLAFDLQKYCRDIELLETCTNPKEGLLTIKKQKPDLVFLDVQMPWMNGYVTCQNLRRLPGLEKARIYAVSGVTGAAHERRCGESGFNGQLSKPADPGSFARLL